MVGVPLVLLRPAPRRQQDHELAQPRRQRALEPEIVAHRARAAHHLRAAQQRHERTRDVDRARGLEFLDRLLLRIGQPVRRNRRHPVLRRARRRHRRRSRRRASVHRASPSVSSQRLCTVYCRTHLAACSSRTHRIRLLGTELRARPERSAGRRPHRHLRSARRPSRARPAAVPLGRRPAPRLDEVFARDDVDAVVIATPASTHEALVRVALGHRPSRAGREADGAARPPAATRCAIWPSRPAALLMVGYTFLYNAGVRKMKEVMAPEHVRPAVLPARDADQPRSDPAGRQRGVGPGAARHRHLQLPARRATAVGVGDRHPRAEDRPRRHRLCDARLHERRDRQHPRQLGGSRTRCARSSPSAAAAASSSTISTTSSASGSSSAASRSARRSPTRIGEFKLLVRDGDIISPKVEPSEPLKNQCADFVSAIGGGRPPLATGRFGTGVVRTLVAIDASMRSRGAAVEV